jgi:5-formyltetrahydrofolate cyclo-ligase
MPLDKDEARKMVRARLANLDNDDYLVRTKIVYDRVSSFLIEYKKSNESGNVLLYQASPAWREVDLSGLVQAFPDIKFDCVQIDAEAEMPETQYNVIFVPLYGFNDDNFRLGHGSGWYDRFLLLQMQALKVGVGFELNRINFKPDFHDIALDKTITDR